jgi:hypothetical protein
MPTKDLTLSDYEMGFMDRAHIRHRDKLTTRPIAWAALMLVAANVLIEQARGGEGRGVDLLLEWARSRGVRVESITDPEWN